MKRRETSTQLCVNCILNNSFPFFPGKIFIVHLYTVVLTTVTFCHVLFIGETRPADKISLQIRSAPSIILGCAAQTPATSPLNVEEDRFNLRLQKSSQMLNLKPATLALLLVLPCITWQGIAIKVSTATASPSNIALMEGIRRTAVGVGSLSSSSASLSSSSSSSSSPPSSLGIRRTAVGVGSWHRSCLLVRD